IHSVATWGADALGLFVSSEFHSPAQLATILAEFQPTTQDMTAVCTARTGDFSADSAELLVTLGGFGTLRLSPIESWDLPESGGMEVTAGMAHRTETGESTRLILVSAT